MFSMFSKDSSPHHQPYPPTNQLITLSTNFPYQPTLPKTVLAALYSYPIDLFPTETATAPFATQLLELQMEIQTQPQYCSALWLANHHFQLKQPLIPP
jgi:hypothetical protein